MPRGGSRSGAGRPPDTGSLAEAVRLESGAIRTLPRARSGAAPAWPLSKPSARERAVWSQLWKLPQAIVWEELRAERQVAFYVVTSVEAEERGAPAAKRTLLLQQENALLLSHASLLRAGFRISINDRPTTSGSAAAPAKRTAAPSSRGRLRAVEDVGDS